MQDGNGIIYVWFVYQNGLEMVFECFIVFKVFLVFIEGGGIDSVQFVFCQSRFQDIGSIYSVLFFISINQGMNFINEEENLFFSCFDFVDYRFEVFFKFVLIFGFGNQCVYIQGKDVFIMQVFWYIFIYDVVGQFFDDCCFIYVRFVDQYGVVFGMVGQDMQYVVDFIFLADYWVEFVVVCYFVEVDGVFVQSIVVVFGIVGGDVFVFVKFFNGCF